jgi:hypothetical protein
MKFNRLPWYVSFFFLVFYPFLLYAGDPAHDPYYTLGHALTDNPEINSVVETVDPFSGFLTLVHTDLTLPGNGGLDVKLMRVYNSGVWGRRDVSNPGLVAVNEKSPVGIGWSMHMGIVRNPTGTGSANQLVPDNPVFEMADGSRHIFYKDKNDSTRFISKEFMVYKLRSTGIWDLTLTDGTVYTFQYNTVAGYDTLDAVKVAQVTSIKNAAGTSTITIGYTKLNGYSYMKTITDSVGRVVQLTYDTTKKTLTSITVDSRAIAYTYQAVTVPILGTQYFLTQVSLPVGNPWRYTYSTGTSGTYDMTAIVFPAGGQISYAYSDVLFATGKVNVKFRVVKTRATGGRIGTAGNWNYAYSSGGTSGDVTTVTGPDGFNEVHTFYGWGNSTSGNVWRLGLPISKVTYLGSTQIYKETPVWAKGTQVSADAVGNANWTGTGGQVYDAGVFVPFQTSSAVVRDGKTYTTSYGSFDTYGNPKDRKSTRLNSSHRLTSRMPSSA